MTRHLRRTLQGCTSCCGGQRMSTCLRVLRVAALGVVGVLGLAGQAGATYCGGASYRCAPAPCVQTQCNVVTLAPQCQTVLQTAFETVYENQPYTVLET